MKFILTDKCSFEILESSIPKRDENKYIVKVKSCGICGSDIPRIYGSVYHYPITIGHEFSGEIIDGPKKEKIGNKVAIFPIKPCGKCEFCLEENYANCVNYDYFGSRCDGGLQDFIECDEFNLIEADNSISFEELAMIEPCAVTLHAIKKANLKEDDIVKIYGAGTIGLLVAMWAKAFNVKKIAITDTDKERLKFAERIGFNVNLDDSPTVIIDCTGSMYALNDELQEIKSFGRLILVGNSATDVTISKNSYSQILRKQLSIFGSWNSDYKKIENDWLESVDAIKNKKINPALLITHKYCLKDMKDVIELITNKKEFFNKIMVLMNDEK